MKLASPRVVIRVCGPGVGPDLVAALGVHPMEVSEARDVWEMHRLAAAGSAILVVVVDPRDVRLIVSETWADFPGVPVLVVSDSDTPFAPQDTGRRGWVDTIPSSQPLEDLCWLVLDAVERASRLPGHAERPLGPYRIHVDARGTVAAGSPAARAATSVCLRVRAGDSLLPLIEPMDRPLVAAALEQSQDGAARFCTVRLLEPNGRAHCASLGLRSIGGGRIAVLAQPLVHGSPIVGRNVGDRDPITGLLTRWSMSRMLSAAVPQGDSNAEPALILVTLDDFEAISHYIGHRQTEDVLMAVASALNRIFPPPALTSRLMGDTFLVFLQSRGADDPLRQAEQLLAVIGRIEVPGFEPCFPLRASVGVADVAGGDHDLALRLAEAATGEARAAGGHRVVVAGSGRFTSNQARQLTASMELGSWEVWLQPVVRHGDGWAEYHEALARFDGVGRPLAARADFFMVGIARGLLERFDTMMLQRVLDILRVHADARIAVNVSFETFASKSFPGSFVELIRRVPDGCRRLVLEIAPRCLMAPEEVTRPRLEVLSAAGIAVALDDFGSGICHLGYLTQWPLAIVKLDQLVTGYVDDDPLQRDFVRTVVSLCRARGISTVAEYTRSAEQLARLVGDGVDFFQGEYFGMPRPAAEVLAATAAATAARA